MAGGDWVIYLLLAGSILAVAVMMERFLVLRAHVRSLNLLREAVAPRLSRDGFESLRRDASRFPGPASRVLDAGMAQAGQGAAAAEEHMAAAELEERQAAERRLLILGTLGNNAPFIGLFGTVLGVIKAFHDLAESSAAGPEVVMRGLSEALIATAVGLFVAIPCVVAYNYFNKQVKDLFGGAQSLERLLLARLKSGRG